LALVNGEDVDLGDINPETGFTPAQESEAATWVSERIKHELGGGSSEEFRKKNPPPQRRRQRGLGGPKGAKGGHPFVSEEIELLITEDGVEEGAGRTASFSKAAFGFTIVTDEEDDYDSRQVVIDGLNEEFYKIKDKNPQGYMDEFESRLSLIMEEVAAKVGADSVYETPNGDFYISFSPTISADMAYRLEQKRGPKARKVAVHTLTQDQRYDLYDWVRGGMNLYTPAEEQVSQAMEDLGLPPEAQGEVQKFLEDYQVNLSITSSKKGQAMVSGLPMDAFTEAYLEAALWSSTDDNDEPLDSNYTVENIDVDSLKGMIEDCERFEVENKDDLEEFYDALPVREWSGEEQAGHDFWLTRNGHGAGFWDRDVGDVGERLTDAAHAFGESSLYVGDDGRLHKFGRKAYFESDESVAMELYDFTMNEADLYQRYFEPMSKNMTRYWNRGQYDHDKAIRQWMYLIEAGAKKYAEEFGGTWHQMFPKDIRLIAAEWLADMWESDYAPKEE